MIKVRGLSIGDTEGGLAGFWYIVSGLATARLELTIE